MTEKPNEAKEPPSQPSVRQEWFDARDLSHRFKCSIRHVLRMADASKMPFGKKFGALRRWSRIEIEEWEKGGCQPLARRAGRSHAK